MASYSSLYINMAAPYTVRRDDSWVRPARAAACGGAVQQERRERVRAAEHKGVSLRSVPSAHASRASGRSVKYPCSRVEGGITIISRRRTCEPMVESAEDAVANRDGQSIRHLLSWARSYAGCRMSDVGETFPE